jgi:Cysteine rich repeat
MECVNAHFQDFTEPCKAALVKLAAVRESCRADIHEQCPAIKPSAGRILLCIKRHFTSLSEPCKEAIGRAAERKVGAR